MTFKINDTDVSKYIKTYKVEYESILSDASGTNAKGESVVDIIARKRIVNAAFRSMNEAEMREILNAADPYFVTLCYTDPQTGENSEMASHVAMPAVSCLMQTESGILYDSFELSFNEV